MEQKTSPVQNGARAKIMRAIIANGMLTTNEIAEQAGLENKQARDNANAARKDGLLTIERDDVTGLMAYKITAEGRLWGATNLRHKVDDAMQQAADIAPPIVEPSDDDQESAISEIPADSPAGIPEYSAYLVVVDDGGTSPEFFRGVEEAKAAALRRGLETTVYGLVQIGRTVRKTVFVPA